MTAGTMTVDLLKRLIDDAVQAEIAGVALRVAHQFSVQEFMD